MQFLHSVQTGRAGKSDTEHLLPSNKGKRGNATPKPVRKASLCVFKADCSRKQQKDSLFRILTAFSVEIFSSFGAEILF
jgi:hypothetical protein